jgi:hypothetical protein
MMVLHTKTQIQDNLKFEVLSEIVKCHDIKQIKPILEDKANNVLIPEGSPKERTEKIENRIEAIKNNAQINHIISEDFLASLEKEAQECIELPYKYSNPNISSAEASQNRCYGFIFGELLEVIKNNPKYIKLLKEEI